MSVLLLSLGIVACTSVQTNNVQPKCYVPVLPSLPAIDGGELFDRIGPDDYYTLSLREKRLTDWALEMEAMLVELCK